MAASSSSSSNGGASSVFKIPRKIVLDAVVGASLVLQPYPLTIPSDCDFELWWWSIFRTSGSLKMLIQETGVGQRPWILPASPQSSAFQGILVDNFAGLVASNGAFPEAVPYIMPANRVYNFQLTDLSGQANTVEIALHGYGLLQTASAN